MQEKYIYNANVLGIRRWQQSQELLQACWVMGED